MQKHKWLITSLVLTVFLMFFRFTQGIIQQDNYVGYAQTLPFSVGNISFFDSRLLPGLPILIYIFKFFTGNYFIAGYLVTTLSFVGSYLLLYKITKSKLSILPLIFPPILLNLASLIDTELPFIFLTLAGYHLIKKEKLPWAFFIIGVSIWFRLAGLALIFGVFVYFLIQKKFVRFLTFLPYFLVPVILLLMYNAHFFGSKNIFYQLFTYEALHPNRISFGLTQLGMDVVRAFRWGWYRILLSGLFYIFFYAYIWVKSINLKSLEFWLITGLFIFTLTLNLVPFLENLSRYLAPTIPLFWLLFRDKFPNEKVLWLLLPVSALVVLL